MGHSKIARRKLLREAMVVRDEPADAIDCTRCAVCSGLGI